MDIATISAQINQPMVIQISATDMAAWFGALGTTVLALVEYHKWKKSRPQLRIACSFNLEIITSSRDGALHRVHPETTFWSINIANTGGEPIKIAQIGVERKDTDVHTLIARDYHGPINAFTLIPGDSHSLTISNELIDFRQVKAVIVMDAIQNVYKKRLWGWRERLSNLKNRFRCQGRC